MGYLARFFKPFITRWPSRFLQLAAMLVVAQSCGQSDSSTLLGPTASPLDAAIVQLTPQQVTLASGDSNQFVAVEIVPDSGEVVADVVWTATGGTISSTGLFTAGATPGAYQVTAQVRGHSRFGTAPVFVATPLLMSLSLSPATTNLVEGATQQFAVSALWSNGSTTAPAVTYSVTGGTMTAGGLYTAGTTPGIFRVIATQTGGTKADTSIVNIAAPAAVLVQMVLAPATVTLAPGGIGQFSVTGTWSDGTVTAPAVSYAATGGTITAAGVYTAGTTPGTYRVIASQQGGSKADTSTVTIAAAAPTLTKLTISPKSVSLATNAAQQFAVSGAWSDGSVTVPAATYSATGGTITANGAYTAGATAGSFAVIATEQGGTKADTAVVTITAAVAPPTLTKLTISPKSVSLSASGTQQFAVSGAWSDGSVTVPVANYSATGGTISASGAYTAGASAGTFSVIATQQGGTKADTAVVAVTVAPPTLTKLTISPKTVSLAASGSQQFVVSGVWSDGSVTVPGATYTATGGTITAAGLYTAAATAGTFRVIASQQSGTKADTAAVTISVSPQPPAPPIYYVSTSGNDAGNGSMASPWRTVAHGCAVDTTTGSVIHVTAGTYLETAQCNLAVGVSLQGDGATSVIKAGYTPDANPIHTFIALLSTSEGANGNQSISQLSVDGNALMGFAAIYVRGRSNVSIHDITVSNFSDHGVTFAGRVDEADGAPTTYATGNQFYNNTVTNSSTYATYGRGDLQIGGQDGMVIHDNVMSQTGRATGTNGYVIKYYDAGYLRGVQIYNNTITKQAFDNITYDFAVELWNILGGVSIYNNAIIGNTDLVTLSAGTYAFSVDFNNNTVGQTSQQVNPENGVELEGGCTDVLIRSNLFRNLTYGVYVYGRTGSPVFNNVQITQNIADGFGTTGGGGSNAGAFNAWNAADGSGTYSNFTIANNTIYGQYAQALDGIRVDAIGTTSNVTIANNIVVGFSRSPIDMWGAIGGATVGTVGINNNDFNGNGNSNSYKTISLTPANVTNTNNITTDPLFVNAPAGNFHLNAGSPAINIGAYGTAAP